MNPNNQTLVLRGLLDLLPLHLQPFTRRALEDLGPARARMVLEGAHERQGPLDLADLSAQIRVLTMRDDAGRYLIPLPTGLGAKLHEVRRWRNDVVHGGRLDPERSLAALVAVSETLRLIDAPVVARHEIHGLIEGIDGDWVSSGSPLDAVGVEASCEPVLSRAHATAGMSLRVRLAMSLTAPQAQHRPVGEGEARLSAVGRPGTPSEGLSAIDVRVSVVERGGATEITAPWTFRWDTAIERMTATADLTMLDAALQEVGQDGPAAVRVEMTAGGGRSQVRFLDGLTVLPPRCWMLSGSRRWAGAALAALVRPDQESDREVVGDIARAARRQARRSAPDALVDKAIAVVRQRGLVIERAPSGWAAGAHSVRTASDILDTRSASPLEAAVLLAAVMRALRVPPTLLLTDNGVVLAYSRHSDRPGAGDAAADRFVELARRGDIGILDPALAMSSSAALLHRLRRPARERALDAMRQVILVVPIAEPREAGGGPLPEPEGPAEGAEHVNGVPVSPSGTADEAPASNDEAPDVEPPPSGPSPTAPEVEAWKRSLLDVTRRNPLINRDSRAAIELRVPEELLARLEDLVNQRDRVILRSADAGSGGAPEAGARAPEELLRRRIVATALQGSEHQRRLASMAAQARTVIEETGANNLYLALGTLTWKSAGHILRSPLILVPVRIEQDDEEFGIILDEAETSTPNYSLLERFIGSTGIDLAELREPIRDDRGIDVEATLEALEARLAGSHQYTRINRTAHLGLFRFSTYRMWKDLEESWPHLAHSPVVHRLASTEERGPALDESDGGAARATAPLPAPRSPGPMEDLDALIESLPLDADSSQARVIAEAVAGRSLVVEGPPGTGKSQTIANLIFRAVREGLSVMFVAEKASALEVVARRLRDEAGMGPLLLNLHDNGMRPSQVREALRGALETGAVGPGAAEAGDLRARMAELRLRLRAYRASLHGEGPGDGGFYAAHLPRDGGGSDAAGAPHGLGVAEDAPDVVRYSATLEEYRRCREALRALLPAELMRLTAGRRDRVLAEAGARGEELRRELGRRHSSNSVRELMDRYGDLVAAITPCVLVSPDSVARFLPAHRARVDLVVIDEASQIMTAGAVGALGRGRTAIVVGDRRQMPPPIGATAPGRGRGASILERCLDAGVPERELTWHYRSRVESLIAFSNKRYYGGRLMTFPSPLALRPGADAGPGGYGVVLRRVNGEYYGAEHRRRGRGIRPYTNPVEANQVVEEVLRRFEASPEATPSIGVITLNAHQRDLVEERLRRAGSARVRRALQERDGLLVRNLDNVQGEERDVILLSLTFSSKKGVGVPLTFGSLSHEGGERRLNVALTRARRQMIVLSSFDPEELHAEFSTHQGIKDVRMFLEALRADRLPRALPRAEDSVDPYRVEIAERLRAAGVGAAIGVGHSSFDIDLVLSPPGRPHDPAVAVMLDGPGWNRRESAVDRDLLPADVLRAMGWPRVERVCIPQWVADPDGELARLIEMVGGATAITALADGAAAPEAPNAPEAHELAAAAARAEGAAPGASGAARPAPVSGRQTSRDYQAWRPEGVRPRSILDAALVDEEAASQVKEVAKAICAQEGPISWHRLIVTICRAFDLSRTTASREAKVRQVLGETFAYPDEEGFVWRSLEAHRLPVNYRRNALDHVGAIEEIHPRELDALMRDVLMPNAPEGMREWSSSEELCRAALRRLSAKKRSLNARGVMEALLAALRRVEAEADAPREA
ncbi:DUF3320 domain-containing protein [Actinomyces timonensis]|uniref:DUF3320 domain-containing protein n=1 Tax=Actinomyces timonensis TaxID=1288391 RepID=A0AAU8N429_9ACTO